MRQAGKSELPDLERLRPGEWVRPQLGDPPRSLSGDLLDLHASGRREDDDQAPAIAIQGDAKIELGIDLEARLAPDAPHRVSTNVHREDARRFTLCLLRGVDHHDASRLAPSADRHLRLDRNPTELACRGG